MARALAAGGTAHRVIVHIDLDCFYAQVEMIHNPELREKPLGVQQKYLVVTCNYEARKLGIKKLMSVRDAKEKCPQLILVNGEDLTPYREISYKVTELLEEFSPLVERLGFDENFVDITEMVEKKLGQLQRDGSSKVSVCGHVYNDQSICLQDMMHVRLIIGSQIAAEMRETMHNRLGLTGCAGVASNKLLSKLVSGTFKPNQQTVLLPESCHHLIESLDHIRKVPGIGFKTTKRLELLGLSSIRDLQTCSPEILVKELGVAVAERIQKLSCGEDDSLVTPSGPPQSFSDEDSFKKCSSEVEVKKKIEELLTNLLDRIHNDGRKPRTIRLTIRQFSLTNKWFNRESRQCPIPPHIIQKFGTGTYDVVSPLVDVLMKLFRKMINVEMPFHITLLSVCFSNLKALPSCTRGSIGFYLTRTSSHASARTCIQEMESVPQDQAHCCSSAPAERTESTTDGKPSLETKSSTEETRIPEYPLHLLPAGLDQEVFSQLPVDIKEEIISGSSRAKIHTENILDPPLLVSTQAPPYFAQEKMQNTFPNFHKVDHSISFSAHTEFFTSTIEPVTAMVQRSTPGCTPANSLMDDCIEQEPTESLHFKQKDSVVSSLQNQQPFLQPHYSGAQEQALEKVSQAEGSRGQESHEAKIVFPVNVDPKTFFELPTEVQKELLAEWKNQEPVSKMRMNKPCEKLKTSKGKKNAALCSSQSNSLLRYFKPN
ncbi:DNA polymerase iota isoform X1 [Alligator mississippiensis]|nr:DNA polymerase iota isoform X1 [Alligator mississippiensis]XP_019351643.1 DNA polymerase iota isoform X1 [Alligator mississippiensis]